MIWIFKHQTDRMMGRGVPQRHVLGACLFLVYIIAALSVCLIPDALNSLDVQKPCALALYSSVMQTIALIYSPFPAVISNTGPFAF